jgi:hypothetical protein
LRLDAVDAQLDSGVLGLGQLAITLGCPPRAVIQFFIKSRL